LGDEGPQSFYRGDIPQTIVRQVRENDGILVEEDFQRYVASIVEPLASEYRDYRLLTPPPPSGGLTTLQILKVLERFELSQVEQWGAEYFHLLAEATKQCWHDRLSYFGDPDFAAIPIEQLLSEPMAKEKAAQIDRSSASRDSISSSDSRPSSSHTANIVAADTEGNVVSVTATQGYLYGSQVAIEGLGLVMGHGMSRFDLRAGSPNSPAKGKRMFHNMAPMVVLDGDKKPYAAIGLPGGPKIVTVTAQLAVSLMDFKSTPAAAVSAPRVHIEAEEPIACSATVPDAVVEQLRSFGHEVTRGQTVGGQLDEIGGKANAIVIDSAAETMAAASQAGALATAVIELYA
jgi:gamma-glutamyltranspeptidase/glutathione hydrolase